MRARHATIAGRRMNMSVENWPAVDKAAWHAVFDGGEGFALARRTITLRKVSKDALETGYARWLAFLRDHAPEALLLEPAARISLEQLEAYRKTLDTALKPQTVCGYFTQLKRVITLLAPNAEITVLTEAVRLLERRARNAPQTRKPFVSADRILALGLQLMNAAEQHCPVDVVERAYRFMGGLIVAFMASRPLRQKNMIQLQLGEHLAETPEGFTLCLSPADTKNWRRLEFALPAVLTTPMRKYLTLYRPVLAAGCDRQFFNDRDCLFLTRTGAQFSADMFGDLVTNATVNGLGVRLTPHAFRHAVATTLAEQNPDEAHIVRLILGHTSLTIADQYYVRAKSTQAARLVQAEILTARKSLKKRRPLLEHPVHKTQGGVA